MSKVKILAGLGNLSVSRTSATVAKSVEYPQGGRTKDGRSTDIDSSRDRIINDFPAFSIADRVSESKFSITAPFYSLTNKFRFVVVPHFNFFTEDEERNDRETRGDRKLTDIPRYMHLKWNTSPLTDKQPSASGPLPPATKRSRNSSFKKGKTVQPSARRGLTFDKEVKEAFSVAINSISNGHISPGVIHSVIELPLDKAGFKRPVHTPKVDEQLYLKSEVTEGLSIHDIQANINIRTNGIIGAGKISADIISKDTQSTKDLFSRKFSVAHSPRGRKPAGASTQSSVTIRGISDKSSLTMELATSTNRSIASGTSNNFDEVDEIMSQVVRGTDADDVESDFTEINFVDPAITGLVSDEKVGLINSPEHAENTAGIAQYLPNLRMISELNPEIRRKNSLPVFPAFEDEAGTEYIGYVIEKYEQGNDGVFTLIETIEIPDRECAEYIDARVAYGAVYRYRMRAILSWVRPGTTDGIRYRTASQTKNIADHKKSFFNTEWSRKWQYASIIDVTEPAPPDEFAARPQSNRSRNIVSWKVPENRQRDIYYFKLFRKRQSIDGKDLSTWEVMSIQFGALNGLFIDNEVGYFQENDTVYVYAAQTVSKHGEFSKLSQQIGVRQNKQFDSTTEFDNINISEEGVSLTNIGAFALKPVKKTQNKVTIKNKLQLTARQGFHKDPFLASTYYLRVESLDTGEKKDIILSTVFDNSIDPEIIETGSVAVILPSPPIEDDWKYRSMFDAPITIDENGTPSAAGYGRRNGSPIQKKKDSIEGK